MFNDICLGCFSCDGLAELKTIHSKGMERVSSLLLQHSFNDYCLQTNDLH